MKMSVIEGKATRKDSPLVDPDSIPQNTGLEKALLGAILYDNDHYSNVMKIVSKDDFHSPLNRKLFDMIQRIIAGNRIANLDTIRPYIATEPMLKDIGIARYLGDITSYYINPRRANEFAEQIHELANLRRLMELGDTLRDNAGKVDPDRTAVTIIEDAESGLYKLRQKGNMTGFRQFSNILPETVRDARHARDRDSDYAGIPTGLVDLDRKIGGLQRSDLIIIAARPSMGKTALATNIAHNIASRYRMVEQADGTTNRVGGKVALFSLEMSSKQLAARILAAETGVPASDIRNRNMTDDEFKRYGDAAVRLLGLPLFIDDSGGLSIAELSLRAKRLSRNEDGIDLLVVDYIQLMRGTSKSTSRNYEVAEITGGLKTLAKELDIPIIAVSQLNRSAENRDDKRPQLSDLRDSGAIEQDADLVMFVDRKSYYLSRSEPDLSDEKAHEKWVEQSNIHNRKAQILIDKNRNGPTGMVKVSFDDKLTLFGNLATVEAGEIAVSDEEIPPPGF